jgi:hypothetical protein
MRAGSGFAAPAEAEHFSLDVPSRGVACPANSEGARRGHHSHTGALYDTPELWRNGRFGVAPEVEMGGTGLEPVTQLVK